jgi:hypothetical protein
MTAAPVPMLPGSRTLLGWWRDLAPFRPRRLWISRLLVHRVEALVELSSPSRIDALRLALLRGLGAGVLGQAHLEPQFLAGMLQSLAAVGLLSRGAGHWDLTAAGREALADGRYRSLSQERRTFYFVDGSHPLHYLPLRPVLHAPGAAGQGGPFDSAALRACVRQPSDWKRRHGFPEEVTDLLDLRPAEGAADWHRVVLDVPEQLLVLFTLVPGEQGGTSLLGFQVEEPGWKLHHEAPVLALKEAWEEALPDLAAEPAVEEWQQAWRAWCQQRGLAEAEVQACRLERVEHRLLVSAPNSFVERLRALRSDALKNETWLLAGDGRTQSAALVEIVER